MLIAKSTFDIGVDLTRSAEVPWALGHAYKIQAPAQSLKE